MSDPTRGQPGDMMPVTPAPPTVSPDGRFYWDGQRWLLMPGLAPMFRPPQALVPSSPPPRGPTASSGRAWLWVGGVVGGLVILLIIIGIIASATDSFDGCSSGSFCVSVTSWSVGSPNVYGKLTDNTGRGCTDPEVTLQEWDHNAVKVRDFTFGAGDTSNKTTRTWNTQMVGLFYVPQPVESNVTSITATVQCMDQH